MPIRRAGVGEGSGQIRRARDKGFALKRDTREKPRFQTQTWPRIGRAEFFGQAGAVHHPAPSDSTSSRDTRDDQPVHVIDEPFVEIPVIDGASPLRRAHASSVSHRLAPSARPFLEHGERVLVPLCAAPGRRRGAPRPSRRTNERSRALSPNDPSRAFPRGPLRVVLLLVSFRRPRRGSSHADSPRRTRSSHARVVRSRSPCCAHAAPPGATEGKYRRRNASSRSPTRSPPRACPPASPRPRMERHPFFFFVPVDSFGRHAGGAPAHARPRRTSRGASPRPVARRSSLFPARCRTRATGRPRSAERTATGSSRRVFPRRPRTRRRAACPPSACPPSSAIPRWPASRSARFSRRKNASSSSLSRSACSRNRDVYPAPISSTVQASRTEPARRGTGRGSPRPCAGRAFSPPAPATAGRRCLPRAGGVQRSEGGGGGARSSARVQLTDIIAGRGRVVAGGRGVGGGRVGVGSAPFGGGSLVRRVLFG